MWPGFKSYYVFPTEQERRSSDDSPFVAIEIYREAGTLEGIMQLFVHLHTNGDEVSVGIVGVWGSKSVSGVISRWNRVEFHAVSSNLE